MQLVRYTQLIKEFKTVSEELVHGNLDRRGDYFDLIVFSPLDGLKVDEGCALEAGYVNDYFEVCTKLASESDILRSSSEYELKTKLSALWKRPGGNTQGIDWWEEAPEIPSGYIGWAAFTSW